LRDKHYLDKEISEARASNKMSLLALLGYANWNIYLNKKAGIPVDGWLKIAQEYLKNLEQLSD
jgi:hypothetical protein